LVDNRVPQVPQHSFAGSVTYAHGGWTAVANGRYAGRQFDDDLNLFDLGSASSLDVYGARRWNHYFETYIAGENLLDSRDRIALTPTPNLSLPRTVRVGLRITLGTESSLQ
jgi:outer membrane receptor protein involved in Fe transport